MKCRICIPKAEFNGITKEKRLGGTLDLLRTVEVVPPIFQLSAEAREQRLEEDQLENYVSLVNFEDSS